MVIFEKRHLEENIPRILVVRVMINCLHVLARTGFDTTYLVSTYFQYLVVVKAGDGKNFPIVTCKVYLSTDTQAQNDFFQPHDEDSLASAAMESYNGPAIIHSQLENNCKDQ